MSRLLACNHCRRHIRLDEAQCPFCGGVVTRSWKNTPRLAPPPGARLSRSAAVALATAALATVSCSADSDSGSGQNQSELDPNNNDSTPQLPGDSMGQTTPTDPNMSGDPTMTTDPTPVPTTDPSDPAPPPDDGIMVQPLYGVIVDPVPVDAGAPAPSEPDASVPTPQPLYGAIPAPEN